MSKETAGLEVVHGSGNVFRDFGDAGADVQVRVQLHRQPSEPVVHP